jgi:transcriptional regulator with XRE-family HTH domain
VPAPDIADSLKTARARLGWSREALAFHSGVSWSAIAQIESGRRKDIRVSSLLALATALGVSVDYLVGTAGRAPQLLEHRLLAYSSDAEFVAGALPFLTEGIEQSHCVLAVISEAKSELLRDELGDKADVIDFSEWANNYRTPAAALDHYRDYLAKNCERGGAWVRVLGEAGWSSQNTTDIAAWTRYESLVNLVLAPFPATFMCTYDENAFPAEVLAEAHTTHGTIAHGSDVAVSATYREPRDLLLAGRA